MEKTKPEEQLFQACVSGESETVLKLLEEGVDPNSPYYGRYSGHSPLHQACRYGHPLIATYLIKWGADVNTGDFHRATPLHYACSFNSMSCVVILLENHCAIDVKHSGERTPLEDAIRKEYGHIIRLITNYKFSPKDPLASYPSAKHLRRIKVKDWLKLGLHFGFTESYLKNMHMKEHATAAVLIAAKVKDIDLKWLDIVKNLLNLKEYDQAEMVCIQHGEGKTALFICTFYGWLEFLKYLIEVRKQNVKDPVNEAGDTIISVAFSKKHNDLILYLVKVLGFDPNESINAAGDTLQSLAESHNLSEIKEVLTKDNSVVVSDSHKVKYSQRLTELISDTVSTILLRYLKMYFIGSSGTGKSTTRKRLTGTFLNLASLSEQERTRRSTYLAECNQALAVMDDSEPNLTFEVSGNHDEETRILFAYLYGCEIDYHPAPENVDSESESLLQPFSPEESTATESLTAKNIEPIDDKLCEQPTQVANFQEPISTQLVPSEKKPVTDKKMPIKNEQIKEKQPSVSRVDVKEIIARVCNIVDSGNYINKFKGNVLINMVDMGGQPGFLEMLPFLSKGPGVFLIFFRLDQELEQPCEVSYERDGKKIIPYNSGYTIQETTSQILAAIDHQVPLESNTDQEYLSKKKELEFANSIVGLVGTFKDKLEIKIKAQILNELLCEKFPDASEQERKQVTNLILNQSNESIPEKSLKMFDCGKEKIGSKDFIEEVKKQLDKELENKNSNFSANITSNFKNLFLETRPYQFIPIDNFNGTDTDIDPLRSHLQVIFQSFFKNTKLRIKPAQLLLGVVLRKEYQIISMNECIELGAGALNMSEEEVKFTVWYLDKWVGALIYNPEIEDEDDWFKQNIICSPQVVFDSTSSLIIESLLEMHSNNPIKQFTIAERRSWIDKGQFSLNTVKRFHTEQNKEKVEVGKLIPVEKLTKLLEHSKLLARLTTKTIQNGKEVENITYFIPAILECASLEELTKPPMPDIDIPSPIKVTFKSKYVPIGLFCSIVGQLVSRGSDGILGMKWELVESKVKRNLAAFHIDSAQHLVTLISHVNCYEIRLLRQDRDAPMYELCSYILSAIFFIMKEINNSISPVIAFDCPCNLYESVHLCRLVIDANTCFQCDHSNKRTHLIPSQEYWFAKEVGEEKSAYLEILTYADPDSSLSFEWRKKKSLNCNETFLEIKNLNRSHFEGYFTCNVLKDGKHFFTIIQSLKSNSHISESESDKFLDKIKTDLSTIRSNWYSLAIELDVDYGTRKAIRKDYLFVDQCFHSMLRYWVERKTPLPTEHVLIRALKSPALNCNSIAKNMKSKNKQNTTETCTATDKITSGPDLLCIEDLKLIRNITWDIWPKWYDLGVQLALRVETLEVIKRNNLSVDDCFTDMLEHWLIEASPQPTWLSLVQALKCSILDGEGGGIIATKIEKNFRP